MASTYINQKLQHRIKEEYRRADLLVQIRAGTIKAYAAVNS